MTRRTVGLLVTLILAILVAPLAAEAQPRGNVHRIGLLTYGSPSSEPGRSSQASGADCATLAGWKARTS
jgi:hypothetical protein